MDKLVPLEAQFLRQEKTAIMKKTRRCSIISIEQSVLGVEDVEVDIPSKYRVVLRNVAASFEQF